MQVIEPDFDRRIDLPGVGPTPRPVDIDQGVTGFADLVSLRIYDFAAGAVIDGEAEGDEVLVTLLSGVATVAVTGPLAGEEGMEFTLQADGDWAIYLPPRHHYRLTPLAAATVAYARARPEAAAEPRAFAPLNGILAIDEGASRLRLRLLALEGETDASLGLGEDVERLAHLTGPATVTESGRELPPAHTLALAPGEGARVVGSGEILTVAALRGAA